MKLIFQNVKHDVLFLMRRAGYGYERKDPETGELSFSKRLGANRYPRFHVYAKKENSALAVNLHLDQKQPSYEGVAAHSGEYDGELVEQEAERIRLMVNRAIREADDETSRRESALAKNSSFLRKIAGKFLKKSAS